LRVSEHADIAILPASGDTASRGEARHEALKPDFALSKEPDEKAQ
jgi:hypothetical protein